MTFNAGATNGAAQTISVPIYADSLFEGNESFSLSLSSPSGAWIVSPSGHSITIVEDDLPTIAFSAASSSISEAGGTATMTVTLGTAVALPSAVSVSYQTSDGSAVSGQDYVATSGAVTFSAGSTQGATRSISVSLVNNGVHEPDSRRRSVLRRAVRSVGRVDRITRHARSRDHRRRPGAKSDHHPRAPSQRRHRRERGDDRGLGDRHERAERHGDHRRQRLRVSECGREPAGDLPRHLALRRLARRCRRQLRQPVRAVGFHYGRDDAGAGRVSRACVRLGFARGGVAAIESPRHHGAADTADEHRYPGHGGLGGVVVPGPGLGD